MSRHFIQSEVLTSNRIVPPHISKYHAISIVTARIRRMTEGNVFTLSTISGGGYPISGLGGGVPLSGLGRRGYPI